MDWSFYRRLCARAGRLTREFVGWTPRGFVFLVLFAAGAFVHAYRVGWEQSLSEVNEWISFALIPVIGALPLLYLANLFRAARSLHDEEVERRHREAGEYDRRKAEQDRELVQLRESVRSLTSRAQLQLATDLEDGMSSWLGNSTNGQRRIICFALTITNRGNVPVSLLFYPEIRTGTSVYEFQWEEEQSQAIAQWVQHHRPPVLMFHGPVLLEPWSSTRGCVAFSMAEDSFREAGMILNFERGRWGDVPVCLRLLDTVSREEHNIYPFGGP
jgi:hypothetical protein